MSSLRAGSLGEREPVRRLGYEVKLSMLVCGLQVGVSCMVFVCRRGQQGLIVYVCLVQCNR
jgi:hypothetical protein